MYQLYNDDYLSTIKSIPNKSIDLIITDPPYLHEKGGRGKMLVGTSLDRNQFNMGTLSDFGKEQIYQFLNSTKQLMPKPQWYIFCSEKQVGYYLQWCNENKFKYNILIWNKGLRIMNRKRYATDLEYIIRIYGAGCALNKLDLDSNPEWSKLYSKCKQYKRVGITKKLHASQKPVELLTELIILSSNERQTILDPFMGSGSTGIACLNTNRNFIGIELDETYFNIAKERIENN